MVERKGKRCVYIAVFVILAMYIVKIITLLSNKKFCVVIKHKQHCKRQEK